MTTVVIHRNRYDEIHRLTSATGPWGVGEACPGYKTYTYDKNGKAKKLLIDPRFKK